MPIRRSSSEPPQAVLRRGLRASGVSVGILSTSSKCPRCSAPEIGGHTTCGSPQFDPRAKMHFRTDFDEHLAGIESGILGERRAC